MTLFLLVQQLATKLAEHALRDELGRLNDRNLADIGLERAGINQFARAATWPASALEPDAPPAGTSLLIGRTSSPHSLMRTQHIGEITAAGLTLSRSDYGHLVGRARQVSAPGIAERLGAAGHTVMSLARFLTVPATSMIKATRLYRWLELASIWRREFRKVRSELACYSERQLNVDLRMSRSEIPAIAAHAADELVAALVRSQPDHMRTTEGRGYRPVASWS